MTELKCFRPGTQRFTGNGNGSNLGSQVASDSGSYFQGDIFIVKPHGVRPALAKFNIQLASKVR